MIFCLPRRNVPVSRDMLTVCRLVFALSADIQAESILRSSDSVGPALSHGTFLTV